MILPATAALIAEQKTSQRTSLLSDRAGTAAQSHESVPGLAFREKASDQSAHENAKSLALWLEQNDTEILEPI